MNIACAVARKKSESVLHRLVDLEKMITSISTSFISLKSDLADEEIQHVLEVLARFLDVERAYLAQFSEDETLVTITHEWCSEGVSPRSGELREIDPAAWPWFMTRVLESDVANVPRVSNLPQEAARERGDFEREGILSTVAFPVRYGTAALGFFGFETLSKETRWEPETIRLLRIMGEVFASVLGRRKTEHRLNLLTYSSQWCSLRYSEDHTLRMSKSLLHSFPIRYLRTCTTQNPPSHH